MMIIILLIDEDFQLVQQPLNFWWGELPWRNRPNIQSSLIAMNSCTAKMPTLSPINGGLAMAFGRRFQHGWSRVGSRSFL